MPSNLAVRRAVVALLLCASTWQTVAGSPVAGERAESRAAGYRAFSVLAGGGVVTRDARPIDGEPDDAAAFSQVFPRAALGPIVTAEETLVDQTASAPETRTVAYSSREWFVKVNSSKMLRTYS